MARGVANLGGRTRVTFESSQMRREVYELYVSTRSFIALVLCQVVVKLFPTSP